MFFDDMQAIGFGTIPMANIWMAGSSSSWRGREAAPSQAGKPSRVRLADRPTG